MAKRRDKKWMKLSIFLSESSAVEVWHVKRKRIVKPENASYRMTWERSGKREKTMLRHEFGPN